MLKLKNITIEGNIISALVLIECDENRAYELSVDANTEWYSVVKSDIPTDDRIYERQAKTALRQYRGKAIPNEIVSAWV